MFKSKKRRPRRTLDPASIKRNKQLLETSRRTTGPSSDIVAAICWIPKDPCSNVRYLKTTANTSGWQKHISQLTTRGRYSIFVVDADTAYNNDGNDVVHLKENQYKFKQSKSIDQRRATNLPKEIGVSREYMKLFDYVSEPVVVFLRGPMYKTMAVVEAARQTDRAMSVVNVQDIACMPQHARNCVISTACHHVHILLMKGICSTHSTDGELDENTLMATLRTQIMCTLRKRMCVVITLDQTLQRYDYQVVTGLKKDIEDNQFLHYTLFLPVVNNISGDTQNNFTAAHKLLSGHGDEAYLMSDATAVLDIVQENMHDIYQKAGCAQEMLSLIENIANKLEYMSAADCFDDVVSVDLVSSVFTPGPKVPPCRRPTYPYVDHVENRQKLMEYQFNHMEKTNSTLQQMMNYPAINF
jgi:hypothetical protein